MDSFVILFKFDFTHRHLFKNNGQSYFFLKKKKEKRIQIQFLIIHNLILRVELNDPLDEECS